MPSINDRLLSAADIKAGGPVSNIPFQGYGGGWGASQIYGSMGAWDVSIEQRLYGGFGSSKVNWGAKLGDPSLSSLIMALYRFLSNVLPEPPLQVKKRTGGRSGKQGESENIDDHPLTLLWNHPNKEYSGTNMLKGIAFSWATRSEAYLIKIYDKMKTSVLELWYEPPFSIRPAWPTDGSEFISHYEILRNGQWIPIPKEQVIHLRDGLNPFNLRQGFDTTVSVLPELVGDKEASYYYANLMSGSGVPPFLVGIDANVQMSMDEVRAFQQRLIGMTTGDRKGEPVVVKGGRAYKLGFTPRELNFEETRYVPEDRFCAVRGVPAIVLQLGSGRAASTFRNVEAAQKWAWQSFVIPLLRHLAEEINTNLLSDFEETDPDTGIVSNGTYIEFDTSQITALQEDRNERAKRTEGLYGAGIISKREARSTEGYGPSDGEDWEKDEVFQATQTIVLIKAGEEVLAQGQTIIDIETGEVVRQGGGMQDQSPGYDDPYGQDNLDSGQEPIVKSLVRRMLLARRQREVKALAENNNNNKGQSRLDI